MSALLRFRPMTEPSDAMRDLAELVVPRRGALRSTADPFQPFQLVDGDGAVIDPSMDDADTRALRDISFKAGRDARVEVALVPVCDGLLIARKKA